MQLLAMCGQLSVNVLLPTVGPISHYELREMRSRKDTLVGDILLQNDGDDDLAPTPVKEQMGEQLGISSWGNRCICVSGSVTRER